MSVQQPGPSAQPRLYSKVLDDLREEAVSAAKSSGEAVISLAWLWPIRGVIYTIMHPQIIFSVRGALMKSLSSSAILFAVLAFFTYVPQAAFLTLFTGPFGPILALFILGAESIFLLTFFAKPLFLEPALQHVFDATLIENGQRQLVKDGKTKYAAAADRGTVLLRPLQALSRDGIVGYLLTLPLNAIPALGTVAFLFINGYRAGPGWHARYFQLKGFDAAHRKGFVAARRPEYTAFGVAGFLFTFVPIVGLIFTFTNTVGAALWAAKLEARANIIEPEGAKSETAKDK
ncbi:hypothetical protein PHLGIDRAFT_106059 [Phlebiopsis gigantea 11061_1 CR5-6]|uniref:Outer spore wall protein RRT8 n=1 Tax=Phlebiopsis gigantea (strain 11061_1 CR5-6) TaxID=745531 RepID=A0A0C3S827_PHLG1|nr:hypothetical protein PHLGIDRAFT_106059 [Phlebiopsis gigantea 11061_1 CR5-6]